MKQIWHLQTYNGKLAQPAPWPNKYKREGGTEPSQQGDVISVQPDGGIQVRPPDKVGPWETCVPDGVALRYTVENHVFIFLPEGL